MYNWKFSAKSLGLATAFVLVASIAQAVTFTIDAANSSVTLTPTSSGGNAIAASLASGLDGTTFDLINPGDSAPIDFLTFSSSCFICADSYDISATLAFDPPSVSATGSGTGGAVVFFGSIIGGNLSWTSGVPTQVDIGGGGLATIDFQGGTGILLGHSTTTSAKVTLDVAPALVPLPASALLLLAGLGGLAAVRRRKS